VPVLQDVMAFVPWPGFGPYDSWDPEYTVAGGETLELAGLTFDVIFTPGHSPGHVTYAVRDEAALFSGDVLFENSVGRIDLPGGDGPTLMRSIADLLERFDDDTVVHPGHMGITTLGRERASNPFLAQLTR
jgi:glyoxylase-like metal-dependent hydrolase (beta-lactamase superfamily II)